MLKRLDAAACWPELRLAEWEETRATLHMWMQVVGKVRLALTPLVNHWWNVPLYVDARGLTTSLIPYGQRAFELRFDFVAHELVLEVADGARKTLALKPRTVAEFYAECMAMLRGEGIAVSVWQMPVEIPNPVAFDEDTVHGSYERGAVERFWRVLVSVDAVLHEFRSGFLGKVSPVHFFWGSMDLAVTRFSGRRAPEREGADRMTREAYSHEVSSVGWWPGTAGAMEASFYSYAAPEPEGFKEWKVRPEGAVYAAAVGEFVLPYEEVRKAASPSGALREFCESTYEGAATLGGWDREALERAKG